MNLLTDLQKTGIDKASKEGKIYILEIWKESGELEQEYTNKSIDEAEDVEILDWWLESGKELKYTIDALINASENQRIEILEWWGKQKQNKRLELKVDYKQQEKYDVKLGFENVNLKVLKWWEKNENEIYKEVIGNFYPPLGDSELQQWILDNRIELAHDQGYYMELHYNITFDGGQKEDIETLQFMKRVGDLGLGLTTYNTKMEDYENGYKDVLKEIVDWYIENNYQFEFLQKERFIIRKEGNDYYRILE